MVGGFYKETVSLLLLLLLLLLLSLLLLLLLAWTDTIDSLMLLFIHWPLILCMLFVLLVLRKIRWHSVCC